jgi:hypothetical protein
MPNDLDIRSNRHGQTPTEDDLFWPEAMRQVQLGMLQSTHWAAAGVLALSLVSWTLVTGAVIFGEAGEEIVFWIIPIILWTLSAIGALRVFTARRYRYFANSPDSTRQAVTRIARKKIQQLYLATGLWAIGVLFMVLALFLEFA